jgi:hypothetical protein
MKLQIVGKFLVQSNMSFEGKCYLRSGSTVVIGKPICDKHKKCKCQMPDTLTVECDIEGAKVHSTRKQVVFTVENINEPDAINEVTNFIDTVEWLQRRGHFAPLDNSLPLVVDLW